MTKKQINEINQLLQARRRRTVEYYAKKLSLTPTKFKSLMSKAPLVDNFKIVNNHVYSLTAAEKINKYLSVNPNNSDWQIQADTDVSRSVIKKYLKANNLSHLIVPKPYNTASLLTNFNPLLTLLLLMYVATPLLLSISQLPSLISEAIQKHKYKTALNQLSKLIQNNV